jgi:uncharacterized protein
MTGLGFDRVPRASGPIVEGLSADGFRIDGRLFRAALLTPEAALEWAPPPLDALGPGHLAPLLGLSPAIEFLLLGTGERMAFAPRALAQALAGRDIAIEAMDSRAAARTWGMLRAEGRWIGAALMPF